MFALQEDHPDGCCGPPAGLVGGCLPWPPCPALPLPCPCPALFVTTNRQIDTTVALIYKMRSLRNGIQNYNIMNCIGMNAIITTNDWGTHLSR